MSISYTDYINTIKSSSAQRILKIEILDNNENSIGIISPNIISGDIQLSSESGSRRSANIVLDNSSGEYIPKPNSNFWINTKYRIWTGYIVNGAEYLFSRGIFLSGEPEVISNFSEQTVSLQLYDKFCNLDSTLGGTLEDTYVIPAGSNVEGVIKELLLYAGEVKPPIIALNTGIIPYTLTIDSGGTYADIINKLCYMVSHVFYFDINGYPRFEPPTNINTAPSKWDYTTEDINYLGSRHKYEYTKVYNYVRVWGSNVNGSIYTAFSQDTNINSGTKIALIGKKTLVINDDLIYSNSLCQQRADYELQKAISLVETVDMNSIPIDVIEGDMIITVSDSGNGLDGVRFLVKSVNFPLMNDGEMTLSVWAARSLS